jgi:hypothetical protein
MPRPAVWFSPLPEYLSFRLSGVPHAVLPDPRYAPFIWNPALAQALGVPADALPPLVAPGTALGKIRTERPGVRLAEGVRRRFRLAGLPRRPARRRMHATGTGPRPAGSSEVLNLCAQGPFPIAASSPCPTRSAPSGTSPAGYPPSGAALDCSLRCFRRTKAFLQKRTQQAGPARAASSSFPTSLANGRLSGTRTSAGPSSACRPPRTQAPLPRPHGVSGLRPEGRHGNPGRARLPRR